MFFILAQYHQNFNENFCFNFQGTSMNIVKDLENSITSLDFSVVFEDIEKNFKIIKPVFDEIEAILSEVENIGKTINSGEFSKS